MTDRIADNISFIRNLQRELLNTIIRPNSRLNPGRLVYFASILIANQQNKLSVLFRNLEEERSPCFITSGRRSFR